MPQACESRDHCNQCIKAFQHRSTNVHMACFHDSSTSAHKIVLYWDRPNSWLGYSYNRHPHHIVFLGSSLAQPPLSTLPPHAWQDLHYCENPAPPFMQMNGSTLQTAPQHPLILIASWQLSDCEALVLHIPWFLIAPKTELTDSSCEPTGQRTSVLLRFDYFWAVFGLFRDFGSSS